jgi:exodeoxyribonuclease VII large subunit
LARAVQRRLHDRGERLRWLVGRASLVSPAARLTQQLLRLQEFERRMYRAFRQSQETRVAQLRARQSRLWQASPIARVRDAAARHQALFARLRAAGLECVRRARERWLPLARTLHAVSPLATLERGYAIVTGERGQILRDAADAAPGTMIEARLARGRIRAKVANK